MGTYILQPITTGPAVAPVDADGTTGGGNFIRSVGSTTPSTTGWNANDVWVDTLNGATANVVRVWSGTAFVPARTAALPLLTELFTGSDAAVWNTSNWVTALTPSSGTGHGATILTNQGKLTSSSTGGFASASRISRTANITNPADANLSFSFKFDSSDAQPQVWIRANSTLNGSAGYCLSLTKGRYYVSKFTSFTATDFNTGGTAYGFAVGTLYSARFYVVGTAIKAKVWLAADAEPATWGYSTTDSTYTSANYVGFSNLSGATGPTSYYIDNVTIEAS